MKSAKGSVAFGGGARRATPNAIGVARRAPHPNAALLFADFMLSLEGQTILKERNRVPSSRAVDTHLNKFPFEMIDPVITLDEADRWERLWSDLFLNGERIRKESEGTCLDSIFSRACSPRARRFPRRLCG